MNYPAVLKQTCIFPALMLMLLCMAGTSKSATPGEQSGPWTLGLAVGHGQRQNPLAQSDDIDVNLVLDIAWYGDRFFFDNGDIGFNLLEDSRLSINAIGTINNERNYYSYLSSKQLGLDFLSSATGDRLDQPGIDTSLEPEDGLRPPPETTTAFLPEVDSELPDRNFALNSGVELLYLSRAGDFQAQILTDVSGTHNGQEAWVSYTYPWFLPSSRFALTVGLEWKSADLADYYYGVRADEANLLYPQYHVNAGVNRFVRFSASHQLSENWRLVSVLEREQLSGTIQNSPIVNRNSVDTFFLGLYYQF